MIYPSPMNLGGQFNWEMDKSLYFTFLRNAVRSRGSITPMSEIFNAAVALLSDYYKRNGKMIGSTDFNQYQYVPRNSPGMSMGMGMGMPSMGRGMRMSNYDRMSSQGMMGGENVSELSSTEPLSGGQTLALEGGKHCRAGTRKTLKLRKGRYNKVCSRTVRGRKSSIGKVYHKRSRSRSRRSKRSA